MRFQTRLILPLAVASLLVVALAFAEGRGEERGYSPPRGVATKFQPHPPGMHPHGPIVRQHPVRVLAPRVVTRDGHFWAHWEHPEFSRPVYYWDWASFHNVSCIAEDSYGDQYPVTEATFAGFGLVNMTTIEDDALDRCYAESGQDPTCFLATCTHF